MYTCMQRLIFTERLTFCKISKIQRWPYINSLNLQEAPLSYSSHTIFIYKLRLIQHKNSIYFYSMLRYFCIFIFKWLVFCIEKNYMCEIYFVFPKLFKLHEYSLQLSPPILFINMKGAPDKRVLPFLYGFKTVL